MVEPVDPPPPIWENIKGKLEGVEQSPSAVLHDEEPAAVSADKTRATLEALEAQLREEGLGVPPEAAEAELLAAARAADWEPGPEHQASEHQITEPAASAIRDRDLQHYPDRPPRSWGIVATHDADCHCAGRSDRRLAVFPRPSAAAITRRAGVEHSSSSAPAGSGPAACAARIPVRRITEDSRSRVPGAVRDEVLHCRPGTPVPSCSGRKTGTPHLRCTAARCAACGERRI